MSGGFLTGESRDGSYPGKEATQGRDGGTTPQSLF
jgi:hypothetical protein